MLRLLLADDHPIVRAGLRALLTTEPDLRVVAEASTGTEAVTGAPAGGIDVVLMDLQFGRRMEGPSPPRHRPRTADRSDTSGAPAPRC